MANTQQQTISLAAVSATSTSFNVDKVRTLAFDVSGTFVGTMQVQISIDGINFRNVTSGSAVINLGTGAYLTGGNITSAGSYALDVSSVNVVRIIMTAFTSGSATVTTAVTEMGNLAPSAGTAAVTGTVTANQGTLVTGTAYNLVTAATTNLTSVVAAATNVFELTVSNPTATPAFVKLYNKATAPVVASDVPVATIPVAANSFTPVSFGAQGKRFATGLGIAVTGAIAATDATATVAGIVINATRS